MTAKIEIIARYIKTNIDVLNNSKNYAFEKDEILFQPEDLASDCMLCLEMLHEIEVDIYTEFENMLSDNASKIFEAIKMDLELIENKTAILENIVEQRGQYRTDDAVNILKKSLESLIYSHCEFASKLEQFEQPCIKKKASRMKKIIEKTIPKEIIDAGTGKQNPPPSIVNSKLKVAVSFAGDDQSLVEDLISRLEKHLRARKDENANKIQFWMFRRSNSRDGIPPGDNDHETIQREFKQSAMGLLLISPTSCASDYIRNKEWTLFRSSKGDILKHFIAVQLSQINFKEHKLGVLGETANGTTQIFYVMGSDEKKYSWDMCASRDDLKSRFVEKLIDELLNKMKDVLQNQGAISPDSSQRNPELICQPQISAAQIAKGLQRLNTFSSSRDRENILRQCKDILLGQMPEIVNLVIADYGDSRGVIPQIVANSDRVLKLIELVSSDENGGNSGIDKLINSMKKNKINVQICQQ
jgi:hypothetical protein